MRDDGITSNAKAFLSGKAEGKGAPLIKPKLYLSDKPRTTANLLS